MSPIVSSVSVDDDGIRRVTTIQVTAGRQGVVWLADPSSVPPDARAELRSWLATADQHASDDGGTHVSTGAIITTADPAPGVEARIGFTTQQ